MNEFPKDGVIYYFDNKRFFAGRLRRKIEEISEEIRETEEEIERVRAAQDALAQAETLLMRMKELAVRAATEGDVDRNALNREFQTLKAELDEVLRLTGGEAPCRTNPL